MRFTGMEELINTVQSDVVGRLAFKYMEMCKVDSSSDSESDTNPRWSDVSSKGCESSAPEIREAPEKLQKNYQQCLDPYDGSSEDSGSSDDGVKKQRHGGLRIKGTGRRSSITPQTRRAGTRPDNPDVQMRSSSDSEVCNQDCWSVMSVKPDLSDSGFNSRSGLSSPAVPSAPETLRIPSGSPDGPALHAAFSKRKFFPPFGRGGGRDEEEAAVHQ
ncbi:uncharacterized protein LOC125269201 isoform X1 [Megalobrama amblycephala]|uniref:uncharacterized protein LOC125269201 isoform X1 n=1 Tax=Megalobrama amblycephala TaxID=75352 RepID=UPI00201442A2|nr:uncharacterized protein LOC125269201 isoform X1 [Megalobrama amblycephala]